MAFTNLPFQLFCFGLVLVLGVWATQSSARPLDDHHKAMSMRERHELWMARHGRAYKDEMEKEKRLHIFKENIERIENFNRNVSSNIKFKLGVNAFADLTTEEFVATHAGYKKGSHSNSKFDSSMTRGLTHENLTNDAAPSIDWRAQGAVTPIKNQKECGCCWAFASVAAVEGLNQIKNGQLVSLSEQELLDCVKPNGCDGGNMDIAFKFIQQSQGLLTEDEYPYQGNQGQCQATTLGDSGVIISGFQRIPQNDETTLMQLVSQQPVSVGIDGSGFEFIYYQGGVFNSQQCGNHMIHAVTVVGYGTDETDGTNYWLLKNSWGESWGEQGYMRIIRDQNQCGITLDAWYPTM